MIVALLFSLVITTITGMAVYAAEEHAGPMASLFAGSGERWEDFFEELHEFFANFSLLLVVIHVAGVLLDCVITPPYTPIANW